MPSGSSLSAGFSRPSMLAIRGGGDQERDGTRDPKFWHRTRLAQVRAVSRCWSGLVCRFSVHALGRRRPMFRCPEDLAADSSDIGLRSIPFGRFHFRKGDMAPSGWLRRVFHDSSALVALYRAVEQSSLAGR